MDRRREAVVVLTRRRGGLPAPAQFSDSFTRSDGAIGNDWTGGTWTIATNKAINTPTLGAEGLTDGGVENWSDPTHLVSWTEFADGGNSVDQEGTDKHGGSYSAKLTYANGGANAYISQSLAGQKKYYHVDYWEKTPTGKTSRFTVDAANSDDPNMSFVGTGDWVNRKRTVRTMNANTVLRFNKYSAFANGTAAYYDDGSAKLLTDAQLCATRPVYPTADYLLELTIANMDIGTMAAMVICLDNPANPQNYVLIYHNGQTLWVKKVLSGGDFATVGSKVQAFSANDKITVAKLDDQLMVYLNDIAISTAFTLDAALKDNLYAGIWSDMGNSFSLWSEQVKAEGGSDAFLLPFFNATDGAIFAIGDSVTVGATDEVTGQGYPPLLCDSIAADTKGYWQEVTPRGGHGGFDILDIAAVFDADLAATSVTATHVLILLGANDVVSGVDHWDSFTEATWKAAYQYVIDAVNTKWASAKIYLGKSYRDGDVYDIRFPIINGWIDDLVAANPGVCFAGANTATIYAGNEATLLVDDVHPNHAGFIDLTALQKTAMGY